MLVQCRREPAAVELPEYCEELRFKSSAAREEGQHIHSICSCGAASEESLQTSDTVNSYNYVSRQTLFGTFNTKTHPSMNLMPTVQYVLSHNSLWMPVCKQTTFVTLSCIVSVCQQCVGGNYIRWQHKEGLKNKDRKLGKR